IDRLYTGKPVERFATAIEAVEDATLWLLDAKSDPARTADVLAGADAYLKLMGDVVGGWMLAKGALAAKAKLEAGDGDSTWLQGKLDLHEVYAANGLGHDSSRLAAVGHGGDLLQRMSVEALAGCSPFYGLSVKRLPCQLGSGGVFVCIERSALP